MNKNERSQDQANFNFLSCFLFIYGDVFDGTFIYFSIINHELNLIVVE